MAVRSNTHICNFSIARNTASNPAEGMDVRLLCLLGVVLSSGLCEGLIALSGESYRVCVCVYVYVRECVTGKPQQRGGQGPS